MRHVPAVVLLALCSAPAFAGETSLQTRDHEHIGIHGVLGGYADHTTGGGALFVNVLPELQIAGFLSQGKVTITGNVNDEVSSASLFGDAPAGSSVEGLVAREFGEVDAARVTTRLGMGFVKFFTRNSFYLQAGAGVRERHVDVTSTLTEGGTARASVHSLSKVGYLGIGNQWTWGSGIVIGFDWLGYMMPATSADSATVSVEGAASSASESATSEAANGTARGLGKLSEGTALALNLGFVF